MNILSFYSPKLVLMGDAASPTELCENRRYKFRPHIICCAHIIKFIVGYLKQSLGRAMRKNTAFPTSMLSMHMQYIHTDLWLLIIINKASPCFTLSLKI